jgi:hypothetical protein
VVYWSRTGYVSYGKGVGRPNDPATKAAGAIISLRAYPWYWKEENIHLRGPVAGTRDIHWRVRIEASVSIGWETKRPFHLYYYYYVFELQIGFYPVAVELQLDTTHKYTYATK